MDAHVLVRLNQISFSISSEPIKLYQTIKPQISQAGSGCSKLTRSLVNVSLKFQILIS